MVFDLPSASGNFRGRAQRLRELTAQTGWPALQAAPQQVLDGPAALERRLREVVEAGGEGLMLHRAEAWWAPGRTDAILKVKPQHDAEAVVLAHVPGRGRLTGRMGALKVRADDGREFELGTGFTDAARASPPAVGARVTYSHQGTTDAGLPRFASFLRVHQP
jgi:DNA ligase-1